MPWGAAIAAAGTIGGALISSSNAPSSSSSGSGNVYQPAGLSTADSQLQGLLTNNYNLVGGNNPYNTYSSNFQNLFNQQYNNPYQVGAQNTANQGGAGYGQVGNNSLLNSTALAGGVNPLLQGAGSVMNTGFDPQNALYSQLLQKTNDAANVNNAQYGLTGQQAAGNVNQADTNFNIDWQNNELQRQISALQSASGGSTAAGTVGTAAQNVGSSGAGGVVQSGQVPYETSLTGTSNQASALQQLIASLLGSQTSSEQTISDLGSYMGQGVEASSAGANSNLQNYYAQLAGSTAGAAGGAGLANAFNSAGGFNFLNSNTTAAAPQLPWQSPNYSFSG